MGVRFPLTNFDLRLRSVISVRFLCEYGYDADVSELCALSDPGFLQLDRFGRGNPGSVIDDRSRDFDDADQLEERSHTLIKVQFPGGILNSRIEHTVGERELIPVRD